jgi:ornithine cyclodeaminase/alanine dehydrogenase-like protein (mu-crystallin family)
LRFIDEAAIAAVLRMEELIPAVRRALIDFSRGRIAQPVRRMIDIEPFGGYFGSMPVVGAGTLGAKLVTFYPGNGAKALPTVMAAIVLFRPETGEPLAILDGRLITEMRTAAVTATFVDAVAARDVRSLAILGAGVQGRSHVGALRSVRSFDDVRIWNRTPDRAARLAADVGGRVVSREEAVRGADVVVVATASAEPIVEGKWLKRGATVASVGWGGQEGAELDADVMANVVIVDSREGALGDSGNVRRHGAEIFAELGEVLDGRRPVEPGATVVFDSIGMACEDLAAATLVYERVTATAARGR